MNFQEKFVLNGIKCLSGQIDISGSKNAAGAILPAAILASKGSSTINNAPDIEDIKCLERIIKGLGCSVFRTTSYITIDSTNLNVSEACTEDATIIRISIYLIGAFLGRFKKAKVSLPGGCSIGKRPIDQHIKGFEALGAKVTIDNDVFVARADKLVGTHICFDVRSVGATINVMLAATLAEGTTILENTAREPHVVDVSNFLNAMGANIQGAGTDVIIIKGVKELSGCSYSVIPDQIEAATFMMASAACGGEVKIRNVVPKHLESLIDKLREMGVEVRVGYDEIIVRSNRKKLKAVNIKTLPYPGFPTDAQQIMSSLMCIANGTSEIKENIFENRFKHLEELRKMGANCAISSDGRIASIEGVKKIKGASVVAPDLRAGASLIIAGLIAEGVTEIHAIEHIDRGYSNIEKKFNALGADIKRIKL